MRKTSSLVALFLPTVAVQRWWRRGQDSELPVRAVPSGGRFLLGLLPYAVSVILRQRKPTDRRALKYFLPYGVMCRHVWQTYDMKVGGGKRDRGWSGLIRALAPYGLVLWWDGEGDVPFEKTADGLSEAANDRAFPRPDAACRPDTAMVGQIRQGTFETPALTLVVVAEGGDVQFPCLDGLASREVSALEAVVVCAGTAHDSLGRAKRCADACPRVTVLGVPSGDWAAACNRGLEVARGKYVAFVEAGERIDVDAFFEMVALMENDACPEIGLFREGLRSEWLEGVREAEAHGREPPSSALYAVTAAFVRHVRVGVTARVFRTSFVSRNRIRFPVGMGDGGEAFWAFAASRAKRAVVSWGRCHSPERADRQTADGHGEDASWRQRRDWLEKCAPLVVAYFLREGRGDLLGVFYFRLYEISKGLSDPDDCCRVSRLLHESRYYRYVDFLCDADMGNVRTRLSELANYAWYDVPYVKADASLMPVPDTRTAESSAAPVVTFIVPVFNALPYLDKCIASLQRQTLADIEMIFVDDGSSDGSLEAVCKYARLDRRMRIMEAANRGPGHARNVGLSEARGRYVAFVDADDWVDVRTAEKISALMTAKDLEICSFDFEMFDTATRRPIAAYWSVANRKASLPVGTVFAYPDVGDWPIYTSSWSMFYRRDFIAAHRFRFPDLTFGEDAVWVYALLPYAKRAYVLPDALYHYRRNNPRSLVGDASANGEAAAEARWAFYRELDVLCGEYEKGDFASCASAFANRMAADVKYNLRIHPRDAAYVRSECAVLCSWLVGGRVTDAAVCEELRDLLADAASVSLRPEEPWRRLPWRDRWRMANIERARSRSAKDVYIVTGQLNSKTNEAVDSWTFFEWLQSRGVPSRYVVWREHPLFRRLQAERHLKDVIVLRGNGVDDGEFLARCREALVRARVVIQENLAINPGVRSWLRQLDGCDYVFMQHGVFCTSVTRKAAGLLRNFNHVNVASEKEREALVRKMPGDPVENRRRFLIAGLPRWDLLAAQQAAQTAGDARPVAFVMMTWRSSFAAGGDRLRKSAYCHGLRNLLSAKNVVRLADMGYRVVLAPHHHLAKEMGGLDFGAGVEIADAASVSKWVRSAAVCVTDFSSVSMDFAFRHKPAIYWIPDRHDLLLDRADADDGGKVESAAEGLRNMGNVVDSPQEVLELLEHYMKTGFVLEPEKDRAADAYFANRKDICRCLYEAIERNVAADR